MAGLNFVEGLGIPTVTFKTRTGDDQAVGGCTFIGGEWQDTSSDDLFKGKKIVLLSLPGGFTPTCSSQQLPGYEEKYDELKAKVEELKVHEQEHAEFFDKEIKKRKIKPTKFLPLWDLLGIG